ncbi:type I phosphomannose isomerase catalytic subunit [Archaeoglobus veneficus]|uniref:Mannose-6-phosphate isomerase n=1 Tax=Archaeoglobus veneficus (strain DSM 11195 / SNP6) TaxID=693661 RepID=F2KRT4_ARCVS|nr:type I phosphomannose isomerase catalytic subunit [Archaeoglobus veneficus]AEA47948.1 Mannose-6-phosphate isomerase [Archaeoglobus veneficus SNP6]
MEIPDFLLQVEENLVEKPWAGNNLSLFKGVNGRIGESWEFSPHPKRPSFVGIGEKVVALSELVGVKEIFGKYRPILVKFIDAASQLSVQVHPSDRDAKKLGEKDGGKEEAWFTLSDSLLMIGFKRSVTPEEFVKAVESEEIVECLNVVQTEEGEAFYVPSGTIHAIGYGFVFEVSTCSDLTYRVYDFGRGRELHLEKALKVMNFEACDIEALRQRKKDGRVIDTPFFAVDCVEVRSGRDVEVENEAYSIVTCIDGGVKLSSSGMVVELLKGRSIFVTAKTKKYIVSGKGRILVSYPR